MLLRVDHETRYRYDRPVRGVVQSHRLTPSVCDNQTVIDWAVTVTDGVPGGAFRDGAGDLVQGWSVPGPVSEIAVRVAGLVETRDMAGLLKGHREVAPPEVWLRETGPTRADAALSALAAELRGAGDALAQAHAMAARLAEVIAYRPGSTQAHTTAAEALAQGEGVCQDHAHALIAVARVAGLPARYVSGYLFSETDGADPATAPEAAHAWAEIWVAGLGWVGFDPANRCCPDDRYIRLGAGFDAQDAAPIRGVARGAGIEIMSVSVAVGDGQQ
jgi:transglutaminase-like putative cysteine protease